MGGIKHLINYHTNPCMYTDNCDKFQWGEVHRARKAYKIHDLIREVREDSPPVEVVVELRSK